MRRAVFALLLAIPVVIASGSPPPQGEAAAAAITRLHAATDDTAQSWDSVFVLETLTELERLQWSGVSLIDGDYWSACPVCGHREEWRETVRHREPSPYWGRHSRTCDYQAVMDAIARRHRELITLSGGRAE